MGTLCKCILINDGDIAVKVRKYLKGYDKSYEPIVNDGMIICYTDGARKEVTFNRVNICLYDGANVSRPIAITPARLSFGPGTVTFEITENRRTHVMHLDQSSYFRVTFKMGELRGLHLTNDNSKDGNSAIDLCVVFVDVI